MVYTTAKKILERAYPGSRYREIGIYPHLPSGYYRDLKLVKEVFAPTIRYLKELLELPTFGLREIRVKTDILEDPKYDYLFSVDTLNELVLSGIPFRDAYKNWGRN
ncbi:hypothetical protein [Arenibacter echinorum]|uniref:Argininosuccinate lyase n=1 Tax=Arenibacter echinorum TaxID=440515 RepID=A0A327R9G4_9FLAO|nr:hypothetical protein [Arenibacter echinorum]RAJ12755.1 argininosuccinate lyase [Arenibacter echinorum]